jgi:hypothetical protein
MPKLKFLAFLGLSLSFVDCSHFSGYSTDDGISQNRIVVKDTFTNASMNSWAFVNHNGRLIKKMNKSDFDEHSKFKNLKPLLTPIKDTIGGILGYTFANISNSDKIAILAKSGLTEAPNEAVQNTKSMMFSSENPYLAPLNGNNYLIYISELYFMDEICIWEESLVRIYNQSGILIWEKYIDQSIEHVDISNDGRFVLAQTAECVAGDEGNSGVYKPYLLFDRLKTTTNTIDISKVTKYELSPDPCYMIYADSSFQILQNGGPTYLHAILNPYTGNLYSKSYVVRLWKDGPLFHSMGLPDGRQINLGEYQVTKY